MPLADHFGRHWPEVTESRPMAYAEQLRALGFRVYAFRCPGPGDPDYEAFRHARWGPCHVRLTYEDNQGTRRWTDGTGRGMQDIDDAIAMAYGRLALYRESTGQ